MDFEQKIQVNEIKLKRVLNQTMANKQTDPQLEHVKKILHQVQYGDISKEIEQQKELNKKQKIKDDDICKLLDKQIRENSSKVLNKINNSDPKIKQQLVGDLTVTLAFLAENLTNEQFDEKQQVLLQDLNQIQQSIMDVDKELENKTK